MPNRYGAITSPNKALIPVARQGSAMLYFQFEWGMALSALCGAEIWGGSVAGTFYQRMTRGIAAALLTCAAPLALMACVPTTYAGISLRPGAVDPELQTLARRAQAGDKHAQLDLGIRYEEGRGVSRDLARARQLYARAATSTGGAVEMYQPRADTNGTGDVRTVGRGSVVPGLSAARERLERLEAAAAMREREQR